MKKRSKTRRDVFLPLLGMLIFWRMFLELVLRLYSEAIPLRTGYLGVSPWANFDGVHYRLIAMFGYKALQQAFFPLFPVLIHFFSFFTGDRVLFAGYIVVYAAFAALLIGFYKLASIDFPQSVIIRSVIFFIFFPTAFFLNALYTESLFLAFIFFSFYFARKKRWVLAGLFAAFASATRIVGIFLIPALIIELLNQNNWKFEVGTMLKKGWGIILAPLGIFSYMVFLYFSVHDMLAFVSQQPLFGANRSVTHIILLPQVIWRYAKILMSLPFSLVEWWVAGFELLALVIGLLLIALAYRKRIRLSYIVFALCALLFPTLTGTLTSLPRYVLACFVIFFVLGTIENKFIRVSILILSIIIQGFAAAFFFRGYFIS